MTVLGGAGSEQGPKGRRPPVTVVIVAAGSGERLGAGRPKALVPVAGRPMYQWSLAAARVADRVGAVVIAAPAGFEAEFELQSDPTGTIDNCPVTVVTGGAVRSESVLRALAAVETELVLIHDAARAMADSTLFDRAVEGLEQDQSLAGLIAAAPVTDTIKRCEVDEGSAELPRVRETLDRSQLWAVQTPQAFRVAILREALAAATSLAAATDDAMLVEAAGGAVGVLPAPSGNFKITTADDLARAELLLSRRS